MVMKRRFARQAYNVARYAGHARTAYKLGTMAYRGYKRRYTGAKRSSARGVTRQTDRSVQYVRKNMPKYKKRKWVAFSKKVQAVNAKDEGTKTAVLNSAYTGSSNAATQTANMYYLYGSRNNNSANELGGADLEYLFSNATQPGVSEKLKFKSAVLDLTFTNVGSIKLEVDVYQFRFYGQGKFASYSSAASEAVLDTPLLTNGGVTLWTQPSLGARGVTPFDMPNLIRGMQATIVKKTKYFVDTFNEFTFQMRDAKQHVISEYHIREGAQSMAVPKITHGVMIVVKSISGDTGETVQYTTRVTRKYSWTDGTEQEASGWVQA